MAAVLAITTSGKAHADAAEMFDLPEIVESIGSVKFAEQLLAFLDRIVGVDHCSAFELREFELTEIATASLEGAGAVVQSDLTHYEVKRQLSMAGAIGARVEIGSIHNTDAAARPAEWAARKRQRITICARRPEAAYCIRFLRSAHRHPLTDAQVGYLNQISGILISVLAKHVDLTMRRPNLTPALSSLKEIERCVLSATDLSRREGEVCARILYGLSSCGIALDLGIGKESVMTYRKRAYHRLNIGSQRELLMWYLALWSATKAAAPDSRALAFN